MGSLRVALRSRGENRLSDHFPNGLPDAGPWGIARGDQSQGGATQPLCFQRTWHLDTGLYTRTGSD
jgi:hypothetical protein